MSDLLFHEALASVAATHPAECGCQVCRAAAGDEEAALEVVRAVGQLALVDALAREALSA
jgi:hypothetical protein